MYIFHITWLDTFWTDLIYPDKSYLGQKRKEKKHLNKSKIIEIIHSMFFNHTGIKLKSVTER